MSMDALVRLLRLSYSPEFSCTNNGGKFIPPDADHLVQRELLQMVPKGIQNTLNFVSQNLRGLWQE